MEINWKKTIGLFLGKWIEERPQGIVDYLSEIKWVSKDEPLRYLGIWIKSNEITQDTFNKAMSKLNLYSSQKQSNSFTILGRILVANTFLLSKLIYSMTLAYVDKKSIKVANSKINRFYNGGKVSSYISHDVKTTPKTKGGPPIALIDAAYYSTC